MKRAVCAAAAVSLIALSIRPSASTRGPTTSLL
jgi:hypothetical protein